MLAFIQDPIFFKVDIPDEYKTSRLEQKLIINNFRTISEPVNYDVGYFATPDTFSPETYKTNQIIEIKLNPDFLQLGKNGYDNLVVVWDFGDGNKQIGGPEMSYSYSKGGSYLVKIDILSVDFGSTSTIEAPLEYAHQLDYSYLQLDVVDDILYPLPEATLVGFSNPILISKNREQYLFDASHSLGAEKLRYLLDFGDGDQSESPFSLHTYTADTKIYPVVLRVSDNAGFFSDESMRILPPVNQTSNALQKYKNQIFSTLDESITQNLNGYIQKTVSRFQLALANFKIGFLYAFSMPFLAILLFLFGFKRYGYSIREILSFMYTYSLVNMFFTVVYAVTFLFFHKGFFIDEVLAQVLNLLGILITGLLLIRVVMKKGSFRLDQGEFSLLGLGLAAIPNHSAYASFVISTFILDFFDASYLLFVFIFGVMSVYLLLIGLGRGVSKILRR